MKFEHSLLLVLLLILPGNIFTQDENTKRRQYNSADRLQSMEDYERAIPILEELIKSDPENANYNFKLGLAIVESYSHKSAIPYLEKAAKDITKSYRSNYKQRSAPEIALEYLAKEYFYEYMYEKAFKTFNRYLDYLPENGEKVVETKFHIETCKSAVELMQHPKNVDLLDFSEASVVTSEAHSPIFSPDESIFIFTYDISKYDLVHEAINDDIYYTKNNGEFWEPIKPLSSTINSGKNEASVGIHPNGKQILIFRDDNGDGNLYYSDLIDSEVWSKPKKFPSEINSSYHESHATISENGDIIYFTSNRPGGFGGLDIYMCKKNEEGKWGKAINMGSQINSSFHEESPHLQAGRNILYFSSDRPGGMGGFDIYESILSNDSVVADVLNIGYPINSPGNDLFFKTSIDGSKGYFSTPCKASKGELSLNIVKFNDVKFPNVIIKGLVLNANLDTLHNLKVYLFDITDKDIVDSTVTDEAWGYYTYKLYSQKKYFASFLYEDYVYFSNPFEIEKYFSNYTFNNTIILDPIILSDSSFRQNIGDFKIFKRSISSLNFSNLDSSLNILAQIEDEENQKLNVDKTALSTVTNKQEPEPPVVVQAVDTPEVVVEIPEPIIEIIPEETIIEEPIVVKRKPEPIVTWKDIADSLRDEGIRYIDEKNYEYAISDLEEALGLYEDHNDKENIILCMNHLAIAYNDKGDLYDAINIHRQVAENELDDSSKWQLGGKYHEIGGVYDELYNKTEALNYFNKSLNIKKELSDSIGEEELLTDIAGVYYKHNDYDNTIKYLEEVYNLNDNDKERASTLNKIGLSYHNLQEYVTAINYYSKAVDLANKANDEKGKSIYLNNVGNAKFDQELYDEALANYNRSLDIKRKINYKEGTVLTLHNIGNTYKMLEDYESAFRYYNESQELAYRYKLEEYIAQNHFAFAQLYALTEKYEKALYHFQEYIALVNPYLAGRGNLQIAQQQMKYEVNQKEIAFLKRDMQKHELFVKLEENKNQREIEALKQKEITQQLYRGLLIGALLGLIVLLILLILRFRTKRKTFKELSLKNAEILQKNEEISAQRENLEDINKELEKLSIVASETDNAVAIINNLFNFEWVNKGYSKLFGYELDDLNISETNSVLGLSESKDLIQECIDKKIHVSFETLRKCKDGTRLWTQTSLTPIVVDDKIYKIISIDSDINELKKAEEEINQQKTEIEKQRDSIVEQRDFALNQKERIEKQKDKIEETIKQLHSTQKKLVESEKMASLGNLVAGVAHEINTPVGIGIAASTSLITKSKHITELFDSKKMKQSDLVAYLTTSKDAAKLIKSNLQRTGELIKSFKRISVDEASEQKRKFNLNNYLRDIVKSLEPKLKEKVVELNIDCSPDIELHSYPGSYAQIITNFIVNTIVHGFENKKGGTISITGRVIKGKLYLEYKDDGNGMTPVVVEKVFNPFFTTNMQTGTGLGMNIVYNTVTQQLQGDISCTSEKGKGVTFLLTIPVNSSDKKSKSINTENKEFS